MLKVNQLIGFGAGSGSPYYISSSSGGISSSLQTISWTHTTDPGTSCLVMTVINQNSTNVGTSTATYNGVSMTLDKRELYSNNHACTVFSLMNPPIGSFTASTTMTGTNNRAHMAFALNLGNVRAINGTTGANDDNVASISSTIATTKPSIICVAGYAKRSASSTIPTISVDPPSGTIQAQTASIVANTLGLRGSAFYTPLLAPQTVTVELDANSSALLPIVFAAVAYSQ